MLCLAMKLTPPQKGNLTRKMRPKEFLLSSPVQRKLKRTLNFDNFDTRRLRLDPTPLDEHTTVEKYHEDAAAKDRRKMQVLLPFGEQWHAMMR
ncbi:hypothetical protein V8E54_003864 [Elaphomyces granulatus]